MEIIENPLYYLFRVSLFSMFWYLWYKPLCFFRLIGNTKIYLKKLEVLSVKETCQVAVMGSGQLCIMLSTVLSLILHSGRTQWALFLTFIPDSGLRYCAGKTLWSTGLTTELEQREERPTGKNLSYTFLTWLPTLSDLLENLQSFVLELLEGLTHDQASRRVDSMEDERGWRQTPGFIDDDFRSCL